jgi:hypothetical protein
MPDVLPFLSSAESKGKKEEFMRALVASLPSVSGQPPLSVQQRPPLPGSSSSLPTASSSASVAPLPASQILIPDTLPPTPLIRTGTGVAGKLYVTKSGAAFFDFGGTRFMVQQGMECASLQHVVHVDPAQRQAEKLGTIQHKLVVVPDLDSLLAEDE